MAYDQHRAFTYTLVTNNPSTSGTSFTVSTGTGAYFSIGMNCTVAPAGPINTPQEIVRVTNVVSDTLTVTRAQETSAGGSAAINVAAGYQIFNSITPKALTDIEAMVPQGGTLGQVLTAQTSTTAAWANTNTVTNTVARAYRNAAATLTASGWSKVSLDTTSFDAGGNLDVVTNHRYNIPYSGYYQVEGQIQVQYLNNPQQFNAGIYKNGSLVSTGDVQTIESGTVGDVSGLAVSDIIQCNAGDYIELFGFNGGATATNLSVGTSTQNYLTVVQLSGVQTYQSLTTVAKAYRNAALSVNSGWSKINIDATSYDPGANCDVATNHRYNVPTTGYYQVNGVVYFSLTGTNPDVLSVAIYKNNVQYVEGGVIELRATASGDTIACTVSDIIQCNAGDYLELWGHTNNNSVTIQPGSNATYLSIVQVGGANTVGTLSPTAQSGNYTAGIGQLVLMTGANTVTLPSAPLQGAEIAVQALTGAVTVNRGGTDTITNGNTTALTTLSVAQGGTQRFFYLGTVWYASGPTAVYPPGYEWSYTQITSNANVTDTAEVTATALISPSAFTPDGNPVMVEFFGVLQTPNIAGGFVVVTLFEGATEIGRLAQLQTPAAAVAVSATTGRLRFTPTNAAHTYKICAFTNNVSGTPTIASSSGGANNPIAYVRVTKA